MQRRRRSQRLNMPWRNGYPEQRNRWWIPPLPADSDSGHRSGRRAVPAAQRLQRRPLPTVRPAVRPRAEQRRVLVGRRRPRPLQHLQDRLASGKPAAARPGSRTKPRPAGPHPRIRHVPRGRRSAFIATTAGFHVALEPGAPTTRTRASSLIHGPQMGHILWPRGAFSGLQRSIGSGTLITGTGR